MGGANDQNRNVTQMRRSREIAKAKIVTFSGGAFRGSPRRRLNNCGKRIRCGDFEQIDYELWFRGFILCLSVRFDFGVFAKRFVLWCSHIYVEQVLKIGLEESY
jgi:hypothetical protein